MLRTSQGGRTGTGSLPSKYVFLTGKQVRQIIILFQILHTRATAFSPVVTHTLQTLINSPIPGLFAWGSQWCGLKATLVGLLSRATQKTAKVKTKPPHMPPSPKQKTAFPLYPSPTLAHPETLQTNPPPKRKPLLPCTQTLSCSSTAFLAGLQESR